MLSLVFRRELLQQVRSPLTLVGALLMFVVGWHEMTLSGPTASGLIRIGRLPHDAPVVIARLLMALGVVGSFFVALSAAHSVGRDFDHRTASLLFTTPLRKRDYLGGRFLAVLVVAFLLLAAGAAGSVVGLAGAGADARSGTGLAPWLVGFLLAAPHLVFTAALFFGVGARNRSPATTYVLAVIATVAFFMTQGILTELTGPGGLLGPLAGRLVAFADPSGRAGLALLTGGWTVAESSRRMIPVSGYLVLHRLAWLAAALGLFALTARRFRMVTPIESASGPLKRRLRRSRPPAPGASPGQAASSHPGIHETIALRFGARTRARQFVRLAALELGRSFRHPIFAILAVLMLVQFQSNFYGNVAGQGIQPRTGFLINHGLEGADAPIILLTLFFAGLLVWRERAAREAPIMDALPVPDGLPASAKLIALLFMQVGYALLIVVSALIVQVAIFRYTDVEPRVLLLGVFGLHWLTWAQVAAAAVLAHVIAPSRTTGYAVSALGTFLVLAAPAVGLEEAAFRYAARPEFTFSDMNGFGPYARTLLLHQLLWTGTAVVLTVAAVVLWPRGLEAGRWLRRARIRGRLHPAAIVVVAAAMCVTGGAAVALADARLALPNESVVLARYETRFRSHRADVRPRISKVSLDIDLRPSLHTAEVRGVYRLVNVAALPIDRVHVTLLPTRGVRRPVLELDRPAEVSVDSATGFTSFRLKRPLRPGEEAELLFHLAFAGSAGGAAATALAENGMILHNFAGEGGFFPLIGYREELEVEDPDRRRDLGLPAGPTREANTAIARETASRDLVRFEAVIRTDSGHRVAAPGRLVDVGSDGGRPMFSFRSDTVMPFEVAIVSGRYAVARASVGGVEVEVLHDPSHAHAVQRMLRGTETGLAYSMDAFGPYPWGVLRIVEVPDYGTVPGTAVSKPGLFVWNERAGFIAGPVPPGRIDPVFSTAVHEAAHQWWGHQIRPAFRGEGALALNETVAQHVRLVGLRRTFDRAAVLRYLADERDAYLFLRNRSVRDELPIARTADAYSAYEKGSLAMHSLARQLGESALTEGLRDLARRYPLTESSGPSGTDLVEAIRDAAPVSLAWLVEDWLDALTFHEASVEHVEVRRRGTSGWSVDVTVTYRRLRSDGSGNETEVEPRGRLEVEVRDAEGELLGVGRSEDPGTSRRFHLELADAPALLELDPRLLLLERDRSDNVIRIEPLVPPRPE